MSLEPVILNTVNNKSDEIKNEVAQQVASLKQDNAAKKDEINAHTSAMKDEVATQITNETERTLIALTQQKEALVADNGTKRDEVNAVTQSAKEDVMARVTTEANRVIAAQSGVVKYGHEEIISVAGTSNRSVKLSQPYTITPPSQDCFIRLTVLETSSGICRKIDLGSGVFNFTISDRSQQNSYLFGVLNSFRVGGRAFGNNTSHVASDGMNPLQHLDGALGMPVKIYGYTDSSYSVVSVAYQIIRVK
ncbi:hypothetical protein MWT34_002353 [Vibrio vulnificus]|nr:hypothetical protein [Vibrio vulnificus]